jgi:phosphotransferase system HPr (HPr) family protein
MIRKTLVVNQEHGLHARPASEISRTCRDLDSKVTLSTDSKTADGRSIMQVLLLAAEQGAEIEVVVEGGDEVSAMGRILELFEHGSGI